MVLENSVAYKKWDFQKKKIEYLMIVKNKFSYFQNSNYLFIA